MNGDLALPEQTHHLDVVVLGKRTRHKTPSDSCAASVTERSPFPIVRRCYDLFRAVGHPVGHRARRRGPSLAEPRASGRMGHRTSAAHALQEDTEVPPPNPANVIVIVMDDMRYDDLAYMPSVQSLLVARGTQFISNYSSTPLCCPSRASLLRGQYPHHTGVTGNDAPHNAEAFLSKDAETLGVWLKRAGYHTGFVGKYLNGYGDPPYAFTYVPAGWDTWQVSYRRTYDYLDNHLNVNASLRHVPNTYNTLLHGSNALAYLRTRLAATRPFYLQVNFVAPHGGPPHDPDDDPRWGDLATPFVPAAWKRRYTGPVRPADPSFDEADIADKPALAGTPRLTNYQLRLIEGSMQQRRDSLLAADAQIERMVDAVVAAGKSDTTAFIFVSDNGYMSGEHRIPHGKRNHYAPSSHVPMVVRGPGFPAGRCAHVTGIHDIAPTVLRLASADSIDKGGVVFDGRPLQDVLAESVSREGVLLAVTDGTTNYVLRGVVTEDRWKYVELDGGFVELYDLTADRFELQNLAGRPAHAAKREELAALTDSLWVRA